VIINYRNAVVGQQPEKTAAWGREKRGVAVVVAEGAEVEGEGVPEADP
jgi:hypothetical protein